MALVSNILTQVFITLIAVAGVYVLTGLTGMFSLGQAAFMAIGSYASGLLVVKAHMPLVPAIIIAVGAGHSGGISHRLPGWCACAAIISRL